MSNDLSVQPQPIHQIRVPPQFTQEDIALIRDTVCKGANEIEFKLFLNQARTTGLNPLARQVFAVKRWDSNLGREAMTIQVSIDGFRLIAERTGQYAGQTAPQWCGEDGVWKDVWLSDSAPAAARVGVLRHDFKEPCYGVARFNGYAQRKKDSSLTVMWLKMGDVMIAKCAESLALRKAFPQELSGLYTSDEMAQATTEETAQPHKNPNMLQEAAQEYDGLTLNSLPGLSKTPAKFWSDTSLELKTPAKCDDELSWIKTNLLNAVGKAPTLALLDKLEADNMKYYDDLLPQDAEEVRSTFEIRRKQHIEFNARK